ncbi:MAG: AAA family ATPase [Clostridia bacterium]|nr:AAA family ATPase [Clostridia bacterium]
MRIKKLLINGYGRFIEKEINFSDKFNLVFGKNEAGKSTIQSFIKAMLFDFPRKNIDGEGRLPDSRKYKPWTGDAFGGILETEIDGGGFLKIERDFNRKKAAVYDENLRDITNEFPYSKKSGLAAGEKLLSMDRNCFENTAFIRQGGTIVLQDDRKNLYEKLMNISHTGNENTSAASANSALSKAITALGNKKTKNRPYNIALSEYNRLSAALESAEDKRREMADYSKRRLELVDEINVLKKAAEEYEAYISANKLEEQKTELLRLKGKYEAFSNDLANLSDEIFKVRGKIEKNRLPESITEPSILENIRKTASAIEKQKSIFVKDPEKNHRKLEAVKRKKKIWLAVCYTGVTLTALLGILLHTYFFIGTAILTALLIYLHLRKGSYTEEDLLEQINLQKECRNDLIMVNAFIESAGRSKSESFEEAETILNELFEQKNLSVSLEGNLKRLLERKTDIERFRNDVPGQYGSILNIEKAIDEISGKLKNAIAHGDHIASQKDPRPDLDAARRELAGVKAVLRENMQSDEEVALIEEALVLYKDKLDLIDTEIKAMETASETISQAAQKLQEDIIPRLNKQTGDLLEKITAGTHSILATGLDRDINTEYQNAIHSLWEFSDGTIDQMYFALRVAAADVFSEKESVPLIIDEAFAYYDEDRIRSTFDLLTEIAGDRQVIVFTCKEKEVELAAEYKDVNIIRL